MVRDNRLYFKVEQRMRPNHAIIKRFQDGRTQCEVWELADRGWEDWAATVDPFLCYAIEGISTTCSSDLAEWLEINHWPDSGGVIVFPSQDPYGDRGELCCFELSSKHLAHDFECISKNVAPNDQEQAWERTERRVWGEISSSLRNGGASKALAVARQRLRLRIFGYDYNPGEELWWLNENCELMR